MSDRGKEPIITFTDERCLIAGVPYPGIPLLVNYDYLVLEAPSDWLRHLAVTRRKALSSVRQYAYHLKHWWGHINRAGVAWDEVSDLVMTAWRDECLLRYDDATVNGYVSTVFRMYLWAESAGYTSGLIGEAEFERKIRPPLSVEVKRGRGGLKIYSSPLLKRTVAKPILPTPTNDEITKVHEALSEMYGDNVDLMIRDSLILTWMEQTGARRAEVLSLRRSQIPGWDEIVALEESGETKEITITGKGGKRRSLWVNTELLAQTLDYIEEQRKDVVTELRRRLGTSYQNPQEVFLSSTSGEPLRPDTVSQKFAAAFRKAGVKGSGHRARARFITNLMNAILERDVERFGSMPDMLSVLLPVAQLAGHAHPRTLEPYLAVSRKRMLSQTKAERKAAMEEKTLAAERRLRVSLMKLRVVPTVHKLVRAIESGDEKKIAYELVQLQKKLEHYHT